MNENAEILDRAADLAESTPLENAILVSEWLRVAAKFWDETAEGPRYYLKNETIPKRPEEPQQP